MPSGIIYTIIGIIVLVALILLREVIYSIFCEILNRVFGISSIVDWLFQQGGWIVAGLVIGVILMTVGYYRNWLGCKFWKYIRYAGHVQYYVDEKNVKIWEEVMSGNYHDSRLLEMNYLPGFVAKKILEKGRIVCLGCYFADKVLLAMDDEAFGLFYLKDRSRDEITVGLENITDRQMWMLVDWDLETVNFWGTIYITPEQLKILQGSNINCLGFFMNNLEKDQMAELVKFRGQRIVLSLNEYSQISCLSAYPGSLEIRAKQLSTDEVKLISELQCPQLDLWNLEVINNEQIGWLKNYRGRQLILTGIKSFTRNQVDMMAHFQVGDLVVDDKSFDSDQIQLEFLEVAVKFYESCHLSVK